MGDSFLDRENFSTHPRGYASGFSSPAASLSAILSIRLITGS